MKIKSQPKTHKLKAGVPLALEKTKKVKINTRCPHKEMKHYAKGMCNHCYHVYGRKKMAYSCPHTDLLVYARGMCQTCYNCLYNIVKRQPIIQQNKDGKMMQKQQLQLDDKASLAQEMMKHMEMQKPEGDIAAVNDTKIQNTSLRFTISKNAVNEEQNNQ